MKRSQKKKELKAKRQACQRDPEVKSGFRKLVVDGATYSWRFYGDLAEIRVPGKLNLKWIVPIWQLHGLESQEAWLKEHENDDGDRGCTYCTPSMIREYIDEMRRVTAAEPVCG